MYISGARQQDRIRLRLRLTQRCVGSRGERSRSDRYTDQSAVNRTRDLWFPPMGAAPRAVCDDLSRSEAGGLYSVALAP